MIYTVSIEARCRHCGSVFSLRDLLLERTGRCPNCQVVLAPDWTSVLLEEAAKAESAQDLLMASLRRLAGLPGRMEVLPGSILRNLFEEIGWDEELRCDPEVVERELRLMRQELAAWERLHAEADRRREAFRLHQLAKRIRRISRASAQRPPSSEAPDTMQPGAGHGGPAVDGGPPGARQLDQAADSLDDQAERLAEHRADRDAVLTTIESAAQLVHDRRNDG